MLSARDLLKPPAVTNNTKCRYSSARSMSENIKSKARVDKRALALAIDKGRYRRFTEENCVL